MADQKEQLSDDDTMANGALGEILAADHVLDIIVAARGNEDRLQRLVGLFDAEDTDTRTQAVQTRTAHPLSVPTIVEKPWGREIWYADHEKYAAKVLEVAAGKRLSLQKQATKETTMYLLSGHINLTFGEERFDWEPGKAIHIPAGTVPGIEAIDDSALLEVSTAHTDDIVTPRRG